MDITKNSKSSTNDEAMVHVGLDVHKETIAVAVAKLQAGSMDLWAEDCGQVANAPAAFAKKVDQLIDRHGRSLRFVYEAGACGFALLRRLRDAGWPCDLVAPTAIPKQPGDRVKTDRRDARELARLSATGYLKPLWIPDPAQEALRNLVRDRMALKELMGKQRQRIQHFLLRHERHYERTKWTKAHDAWLRDLKFDESADQVSLLSMSILNVPFVST